MGHTHTPIPWNLNETRLNEIDAEGIECFIECYGTENIGESISNAKHIIKCVNSHDDLLAALKAMTSKFVKQGLDSGYPDIYEQALQAIQKAES